MLVVSRYALDAVPYNVDYDYVTWKTCTLRKWLNDKFYSAAFNETEQGMIKKVTLQHLDNPEYTTPGGKDTRDKVFLLSLSDVVNTDYGFSADPDNWDVNRRCATTAYAKAQGVYTYSDKTKDGEATCFWWLRTPGLSEGYATVVYSTGPVDRDGDSVSNLNDGVRPALYIDLNP